MKIMKTANAVQDSPFDSDHYHIKVGKLNPNLLPLDVTEARDILHTVQNEGYKVLFVGRVESSRQAQIDILNQLGAKNFGTEVTSKIELGKFERPTISEDLELEYHDQILSQEDINRIAQISSSAFSLTHLVQDPRLSREDTGQLYADWVKNDCTGRAAQTVIVRSGDSVAGFLTILLSDNEGRIDLLAVAEEFRRKGIGSLLVQASLWWLSKNAKVAFVSTEKDNPSLGLYQKYGFKPYLYEETFHLWLDDLLTKK